MLLSRTTLYISINLLPYSLSQIIDVTDNLGDQTGSKYIVGDILLTTINNFNILKHIENDVFKKVKMFPLQQVKRQR